MIIGNMAQYPPLKFTVPTALLLIDNQSGFTHASTASSWGNGRSNPLYEPDSPLHPSHPAKGIRPLDFAVPAADGKEPVFWKSVNSSFIGTNLESHLRENGIRQLIIAGLTTDHCVSTTTRMAANLKVVDRFLDGGPVKLQPGGTHGKTVKVEAGRIILVSDATATFGKGGFDAETIHKVSIASLEGEFAEILGTEDIVKALKKL